MAVRTNARKDKDLTVDGTLPSEKIAQMIGAVIAKRAEV
jgi:hypothetical protein